MCTVSKLSWPPTSQYFTKKSESWQKCCRCPGLLTFVWKLETQFWPPCLDKVISSPAIQHYCCKVQSRVDLLFHPFFRGVPWYLHPQGLKDIVVPLDHKKHACLFPKCVGFSHADMQEAGTVIPAWAVVLHLSCNISFCGGLLLLLLLGSHSRNMSSLENYF